MLDSDDDDDVVRDVCLQEEEDFNHAIQASLQDNHLNRHTDENLVVLLKEHQQKSILHEEGHQIIVRRAKLLPTAFNAIKSPIFNCCKNLVVRFSGEAGQDTGGLRREFFRLVMKQLTETMTLFEGRSSHMTFTHNILALEENKFFLAGRLVGMSITHCGPGLCCLDPLLFKLMCGTQCDLSKFDIHEIGDDGFVKIMEMVNIVWFSSGRICIYQCKSCI